MTADFDCGGSCISMVLETMSKKISLSMVKIEIKRRELKADHQFGFHIVKNPFFREIV